MGGRWRVGVRKSGRRGERGKREARREEKREEKREERRVEERRYLYSVLERWEEWGGEGSERRGEQEARGARGEG